MAEEELGFCIFDDEDDSTQAKVEEAPSAAVETPEPPKASETPEAPKAGTDDASEDNEIEKDRRYLVFRLSDLYYATPLLSTREVIEPTEVREMPNTTDYFLGVANIRGEVVGMIDLSIMLGIKRKEVKAKEGQGEQDEEEEHVEHSKRGASIIFETENGSLGVAIDEIKGVIPIEDDMIDTEPHIKSKVPHRYFLGIANISEDLITILDLKKILTDDDMVTLKKKMAA